MEGGGLHTFSQMYVGLVAMGNWGRETNTCTLTAIPLLLRLSPGSESY